MAGPEFEKGAQGPEFGRLCAFFWLCPIEAEEPILGVPM